MPDSPPSRFWRRTRLTFRWCRIAVWFLLLALLCAGLWVNRVGVPDFVRHAIVAELEGRGVHVSFQRMRLLWYRGIVAENVRFRPPEGKTDSPLSARMMSFRPDFRALARGEFRLHGFSINDGEAVIALTASNLPPRSLAIHGLNAQVDLLRSNLWQLSLLEGQSLGVRFSFSGTLTNGPLLLAGKRPEPATGPGSARWLNLAVGEIEKSQFTPSLQLRGSFWADAARPELASGRLNATTVLFNSPWGTGRDLEAVFTFRPASSNLAEVRATWSSAATQTRWGQVSALAASLQAELPFPDPRPRRLRGHVEGSGVNTLWGRARRLDIEAHLDSTDPARWAADADLTVTTQGLQAPWGEAGTVSASLTTRPNPTNNLLARAVCRASARDWRGEWWSAPASQFVLEAEHSASNPWPRNLQASVTLERPELTASNVLREIRLALRTAPERQAEASAIRPARGVRQTVPVRAGVLRAQASAALPPWPEFRAGLTNAAWSERLAQTRWRSRVELGEVALPNLTLDSVEVGAQWQAPVLALEHARVSLWKGQLNASGRLDASRGEVSAGLTLEADLLQALPFLVTNAPAWRKALVFDAPPRLDAQARLDFPPRRPRPPGWAADALRAGEVTGSISCGPGRVQGVGFTTARGGFALSNQVFSVNGLRVVRPEGALELSFHSPLDSPTFLARARSTINPLALEPALRSTPAGRTLDYFQFTDPPELDLEASGRWKAPAQISLAGLVRLTNAAFRGQSLRRLAARVTRTNQCVEVRDLLLLRDEGQATADCIRVDLAEESVRLTNLHSTVDPGAVAAAIGPHIVKTLEPYRFGQAPRVFFEGRVGLRSNSGLDDARFDVAGGPFEWFRFKLDRVNASLHWLDETLQITNFVGAMRGGEVRGHAHFNFAGGQGTRFAFDTRATNVDAHLLVRDVFPGFTNTIEGTLSGRLHVTRADSTDPRSWHGDGDLAIRDGLLWDIPVLKLLSPMMNAVVPGIGNSRARQAAGTFLMTNSVIFTPDLEVNASAMRLQFQGTIDLEGALNARVEAELFRDTPGFGLLISRVFWPVTKAFSYRIQGTLGSPRLEPLYIPKLLMAPFHPFRTLRELFSEGRSEKDPADPPTSLPSPTNRVNFP